MRCKIRYGAHTNEKLAQDIVKELIQKYGDRDEIDFVKSKEGLPKEYKTFREKIEFGSEELVKEMERLAKKSFLIDVHDSGPSRQVDWTTEKLYVDASELPRVMLLFNYTPKVKDLLKKVVGYIEERYGKKFVTWVFSKGFFKGDIIGVEIIADYNNKNYYEAMKKIGVDLIGILIDTIIDL